MATLDEVKVAADASLAAAQAVVDAVAALEAAPVVEPTDVEVDIKLSNGEIKTFVPKA